MGRRHKSWESRKLPGLLLDRGRRGKACVMICHGLLDGNPIMLQRRNPESRRG